MLNSSPHRCANHVVFFVGDRRRVSMATASALEGLGPMQRRDSKVGMMIKMFKSPDTHASFLTSSRFAHDLIAVGPYEYVALVEFVPYIVPHRFRVEEFSWNLFDF